MPYPRLPPQQREIAKADFHPFVYDLTRRAELHLRGLGYPRAIRPTGHWWHGALTAGITSAIAIEAGRRGFRYLPAHEILNRSGAPLAIPMGRRKLIPDQLFAIDYGGAFRSFVLEVDRGTEPYRSEGARRNLTRMVGDYAQLNKTDSLRAHYGLKSPLLLLMAFTAPERAARCLEIIGAQSEIFAAITMVAVVSEGYPRCSPLRASVSGHWRRANHATFGLFE